MDIDALIREADPVRHVDPVTVDSEDAQLLYRQIIARRIPVGASVSGSPGPGAPHFGDPHSADGRSRVWRGSRKRVLATAAALLLLVALGTAVASQRSRGSPTEPAPS